VLRNEAQYSYSIAGKVFILGEYAALAGLPSLVAAVGPRFRLTSSSSSKPEFAAESPAGRLLKWAEAQGISLTGYRFQDPFGGKGGFGASTAQFALTYFALCNQMDWDRRWLAAWKLYRELTAAEKVPPSGADLVGQWQGSVTYFDPRESHCLDLWPMFDWSNLLVFSAAEKPGRKVATHLHLPELAAKGFPEHKKDWVEKLESILLQGADAIRENDSKRFGLSLDEYGEALSSFGLEAPEAQADRSALRSIPGVLGVKGAGALQSDAMIILVGSDSSSRAQVIEVAKARGLKLVSDGLTAQTGICLASSKEGLS
jgi:mevalonate kinase